MRDGLSESIPEGIEGRARRGRAVSCGAAGLSFSTPPAANRLSQAIYVEIFFVDCSLTGQKLTTLLNASPPTSRCRARRLHDLTDIARAMPLYDYESDRALERSQSDVERANPSLVCPITAELFRDPVLCVGDGYTYEREAAEKWFADGKTTSPMTGAELPESQRRLVPNFNARTRADQARGGAPDDGIRVNDFSVHVEDRAANETAEPAEPSAPDESAGYGQLVCKRSDAKTSGGAGSSGSGSSAKVASPSKGQSLMDWVRGYRGADGGPRRDQPGAYSWFDGNGWGKSRPLHRAAMRGEVETIRSLCRGGRDPNEKMVEWFDSEPLGWAASLGQLDSVRALIESGADPLRPANKAGNTPMSDAQRERHQHVVSFLEEYEQRARGVPTLSPAEVQKLTPGNLKIHEARYGWAGDIWGVTPSPNKSGSGAKDVTDIVRRLVHDDELDINPTCEPQYMNRTFWPETASGPPIPRKLGVRYSYGDGPAKEETTHAVPHETVRLRVTRAKYVGAAVAPTVPAATGKRFPPINPSLNGELNDCARNTNDTARLRDLVARGADLTSTNGFPWHHTPMHQSAYHNRPDMVKTLVELCAERGVLERVLAMGSNPCGRGWSGTPLDLARGGGHRRCVEILAGAHSGPTTQTMSRDLPLGIHSAYDLQGCWGCVCWPVFGACETKRAEGPDVLRHTGVCLPFCLPYSDVWEREGQSNTFRKRGADDRLAYPGDNPGCICFGLGVSWRWRK